MQLINHAADTNALERPVKRAAETEQIFNVVLIPDKDENVIKNGKHFVLFNFRSSHAEVFCKKGVLRNSAKFKRKYLCQGLFFCEFARLNPATLFY